MPSLRVVHAAVAEQPFYMMRDLFLPRSTTYSSHPRGHTCDVVSWCSART